MEPERRLTITTLSVIVILAAVVTTGLLYFFGPQTSNRPKMAAPAKKSATDFFPTAGQRAGEKTIPSSLTGEEATFTPESSGDVNRGTRPGELLPTTAKLFKITDEPIAGATFAEIAGSSSPLFIDRATGHLFRILADTHQVQRLTNTTIPLTQDMVWGTDGKNLRVVLRSLKADTIINFSGYIKFASTTASSSNSIAGEIKGGIWPEQILSLAVAPSGKQIFTLRTTTAGIVGIINGWDLREKTPIFTAENSEWLIAWPTADTILLATKPSAELPGSVYILKTKTGERRELLSGIRGLTASLSPSGQRLLYSEAKASDFSLKLSDLKTGAKATMNFKTLPEKCVWSKNSRLLFCAVPNTVHAASYPDAWYRGEFSFADSLWRFNLETGETKLLINTAESNLTAGTIDAINLFLDTAEKQLFFTNKADGTFWLFELN